MNMLEPTEAFLLKLWKDQDIQIMVLISLMVQLFLLFTANLRRRRISGLLRLMIWLAYVGADAVAVFAIGLLSQYVEKYKSRSLQLTEDHTLPFLWAPILLLHLGGQDSITAFSMEDSNLWLRHLLNLVVQVTLTLYVFWKPFDILNSQLLAIAAPIFVAGLIKYGERTWALYSASREYLSSCNEGAEEPLRDYRSTSCGDVVASYALNTVLRVRGLFVGRTLFQLEWEIVKELVHDFERQVEREVRFKIVMAELDMTYDLLYTKAMVLQSRTGRIFRGIAEASMVVAFVLFLANHQLDGYNRADRIITYTLFAGALFMEAWSVSMVIASPWTRASLKKGSLLLWLSCSACSVFNAIVRRKTRKAQQQQMSCFSMGQFNLTDYSMSQNSRPKLISKGVSLLGLEKQERNILHIEHVKDKGISEYIGSLYSCVEVSLELQLGRALLYVLNLPFEHALFRLHIYTDLYLSSIELQGDEMALLAAECMTLSNYLMHLMLICPYMLPVGSIAQDLEPTFTKWVRGNCSGTMTKREILEQYTQRVLHNETFSVSPFESLPHSVASLTTIKEMWARLLIYAAGKCPMEMHARQLSNGVEPITFLSFLMLHHADGDAGKREVSLFTSSDDPHPAGAGSLVSMYEASWGLRPYGPRYAFEFRQDALGLFVAPWASPLSTLFPMEYLSSPETSWQQDGTYWGTSVGSEMEQQQTHAAPEVEQADPSLLEREQQFTSHQDTSPSSDVASEIPQNQADVVIDVAALAPEIDQVVDAALNTEEAGYMALEIEHKGEPGNRRPI